jgi:hypothetical protein
MTTFLGDAALAEHVAEDADLISRMCSRARDAQRPHLLGRL